LKNKEKTVLKFVLLFKGGFPQYCRGGGFFYVFDASGGLLLSRATKVTQKALQKIFQSYFRFVNSLIEYGESLHPIL